MFRAVLTAWAIAVAIPVHCAAQEAAYTARIGVLAYLGYEDTLVRWHGLKRYLDASVPDHEFELVPMTLASASSQIASGQIDFVLTNPGHFVDLAKDHAMSVLASRAVRRSDGTYSTEFGSLIFARAGSGLQTPADARGRTVVAIDKMAFGGFQLAWREFEAADVNLFIDTDALIFAGFPMDAIIDRVASGTADIGIIRSGLMERVLAEGRYRPEDFVYLNTNVTLAHPDRISTRLYPEWPFAALASVDPELRDDVAHALMHSKDSPLAREVRMANFWSSPAPYKSAVELNAAFDNRRETSPSADALVHAWPWALAILSALLGLVLWRGRLPAPPIAAAPEVIGPAPASPRPTLTKREQEVLDLIAQGFSSKEIALKLDISPKTVEFHRANLLRKFDARSATQLVALAT